MKSTDMPLVHVSTPDRARHVTFWVMKPHNNWQLQNILFLDWLHELKGNSLSIALLMS